MNNRELKEFLDEKVYQFNRPNFIKDDPISIPHEYNTKQDIEIAGFIAATIAWGNRKSIITNAKKIMDYMGNSPHEFVLHYHENNNKPNGIVHRTFNSQDLDCFLECLNRIYKNYTSLEDLFAELWGKYQNMQQVISEFKNSFFDNHHSLRTQKHISNPIKNSSAKRINMYLRWMVRTDNAGVDFGIWKSIPSSVLKLPLDVHTGTISRKLGILSRKQDDWKAVEEVSTKLLEFDSEDPIKYDFALFGLGAIEKF